MNKSATEGKSDATDVEVRKCVCPQCGHDLKRLWSNRKERYYWFCQSAQDDCGRIFPDANGEPRLRQISREPVPALDCPECGAGMELISGGRYGPFLSCADQNCGATIDLFDQSAAPGPDNLPPLCPNDESHGFMRRRGGKNGPFWGCAKYPTTCQATRPLDVTSERAEEGHDDR